MVEAAYNVADALRALGRDKDAEAQLRQLLLLLETPGNESADTADNRFRLVGTHRSLHFLLRDTARPEEAEEHARKALALVRDLVEEYPQEAGYRISCTYLLNEAAFYVTRREGSASEQEQLYRELVPLAEELIAEAKSPDSRLLLRLVLAKTHRKFHFLLRDAARLEEAEDHACRSFALFRGLLDNRPNHAPYRIPYCYLLHEIAYCMLRRGGDASEAEALYRELIPLADELMCELDSSHWNEELGSLQGVALSNLASILVERGEQEEARQLLSHSIDALERLARASDRFSSHHRLRGAVVTLCRLLLRLGDHAGAAAAGERLLRAIPDGTLEHVYVGDVLASCGIRAKEDSELTADEQDDVSEDYWERARTLYSEAVDRLEDSPEEYNIVAWSLATVQAEAVRDAPQAVRLAENAVQLAPDEPDFWTTLGVARYRAGDWQGAAEALETSLDGVSCAGPINWLFLAMAHAQLGDLEDARRTYDQATSWFERNIGDNGQAPVLVFGRSYEERSGKDELNRFRTEAAELLGLTESRERAR